MSPQSALHVFLLGVLTIGVDAQESYHGSDRVMKNLGPQINTKYAEFFPSIAPDGLTLYFSSDRPAGAGESSEGSGQLLDIYVAVRESVEDAFGTAENLGPTVNSPARDYVVGVSDDAHWLYMVSDRLGADGPEYELFASYRGDIRNPRAWQRPQHLVCTVETESGEDCEIFSTDRQSGELKLHFLKLRIREFLDFETDDVERGESDLNAMSFLPTFDTDRSSSRFTSSEDDSEQDEVLPTRSKDGQVFFSSNKPGGFGDFDLYRVIQKRP